MLLVPCSDAAEATVLSTAEPSMVLIEARIDDET